MIRIEDMSVRLGMAPAFCAQKKGALSARPTLSGRVETGQPPGKRVSKSERACRTQNRCPLLLNARQAERRGSAPREVVLGQIRGGGKAARLILLGRPTAMPVKRPGRAQLALGLAHHRDEAAEQEMAVARPGGSFRMILHREDRPVFQRSTAKPWFIDVISTLPVVRSLTGWFAP